MEPHTFISVSALHGLPLTVSYIDHSQMNCSESSSLKLTLRLMPSQEQEALEAFKDAQEMHMYAVWALPPTHVLPRIKTVMEGLRAEFGGPEIEPHITVLGSMLRTEEDAIQQFKDACNIITRFECNVDHIETSRFFYQCVSLIIDPIEDLWGEIGRFVRIFEHTFPCCPHLSLLYGYLTDEEKKRAKEKVTTIDEGFASLSFDVTRFVLCKMNIQDKSQHSWEKILAIDLQP
ncbi:cyclic phosphodiesterase-like isoform X1 [Rosa rugosa]|uniref:cyclic phosphodiesterase-like isoform X1 n=2 Tax=Rosa rugosa TaxID=74645 RepID=UPI002B40CF0C|nr:cyclic phosphodiesterase-like isoform X1 [Rosa rugosa]